LLLGDITSGLNSLARVLYDISVEYIDMIQTTIETIIDQGDVEIDTWEKSIRGNVKGC